MCESVGRLTQRSAGEHGRPTSTDGSPPRQPRSCTNRASNGPPSPASRGRPTFPSETSIYYFETKDELVQAALSEHSAHLDQLTGRLDELPDPRDRLRALIEAWVGQRDIAARYGCPTGTLAAELDERPTAPSTRKRAWLSGASWSGPDTSSARWAWPTRTGWPSPSSPATRACHSWPTPCVTRRSGPARVPGSSAGSTP